MTTNCYKLNAIGLGANLHEDRIHLTGISRPDSQDTSRFKIIF